MTREKSRAAWLFPRPDGTYKFHIMRLIVKPFYESNWFTNVKIGISYSIMQNEEVCGEEEWTFTYISLFN